MTDFSICLKQTTMVNIKKKAKENEKERVIIFGTRKHHLVFFISITT